MNPHPWTYEVREGGIVVLDADGATLAAVADEKVAELLCVAPTLERQVRLLDEITVELAEARRLTGEGTPEACRQLIGVSARLVLLRQRLRGAA